MRNPDASPMKKREKFAFFLLNLGNIPLMTLISGYLMIFYTDVVGLNPASVATLFLIARVVDGINDPIMGYFLDRMPTRSMGKFRPILLLGTFLCVLNYAMVWFAPLWVTGAKLAVAYISYLLLGVTFDLMDISLNSLLPLLSTNAAERTRLSSIKAMGYTLGGNLLSILAPLILADTARLHGYYVLVFGALFFVVLFSVLGVLGVREHIHLPTALAQSGKLDLGIFWEKPIRVTTLSSLLSSISSSLSGAVSIYFFTYVLGDVSKMSILSALSLFSTTLGVLCSGKLISHLGTWRSMILFTLLPIPFSLLRLVNVKSFSLILLASFVSSFCSSACQPARFHIQADNSDYILLHRNHHAEATIATLSSFTTKCAMGIGGALPGYFLAAAGFQKALPVQPASVITTMIMCTTILPALFSLFSALLFAMRYPHPDNQPQSPSNPKSI